MNKKNSLFTAISHLLFVRGGQRRLFLVVIFTITLTAASAAIFPVFFSLGIDALSQGGDRVSVGIRYVIAFGIGLTIVGVLEQVQWLTFGPLNLKLQRQLTTHVFRHALSLPYRKLKEYTTYEIGRTVERGLDSVREITSNLTFFLIPTLIELVIAASVIAVMIDVWIAVFLFLALFLYAAIANVSASKIRKATENAMETGIQAWTFGLDGVANAELVQQANKVNDFTERLNVKLKENDRAWAITFKQRAYFGALQAAVFGMVVLGVLWRGATDVGQGLMSIGNLVLLNTYIIRLLQPVETFARVYREVNSSLGEARLLMELLETPASDLAPRIVLSQHNPMALELSNIEVSLNDRTLLKNLTFSVAPCERVYIVGPSGVGKSSLLKMISCLSVADSGEYRIDGEIVTEISASRFRPYISVVQQDCLLFDWTIAENIAFGSEVSSHAIADVISKLGLDEVVLRNLQEGEPTVGERGSRLSGGEKQRVSLARALISRPRLLLLDEPTAALDESNRRRVLEAILELQNNCTTIFVTHDLSLLEPESKVVFLSPNHRYWIGTHNNVFEVSEEYRKFVKGQLAGSQQTE